MQVDLAPAAFRVEISMALTTNQPGSLNRCIKATDGNPAKIACAATLIADIEACVKK